MGTLCMLKFISRGSITILFRGKLSSFLQKFICVHKMNLRFNLKINKFCKILLTNFSKLSSKRLLKQFKANWTVVYNKTYTILLKNEVLYQDGYRNKFQAGTRVWISEGIMLYRIICMIPVRMKIIISNKINWNQISSLNKISCLRFNFLKLILSNLKQLFRN